MTSDNIVVIGAGALGLSTALHCALLGRPVVLVERDTAGSQASGRAAGLFKSVQADELRTIIARRSIDRALSFGDWAGAPLEVTSRAASWWPGPAPTGTTCVPRRASRPAGGCPWPRLRCPGRCPTTRGTARSWPVPLAAELPAAEHRGGLFTMTPDGRFVAGPVPDAPGLWVASGCNGSGFSSSLALGEALAAWICDVPGRLDISALAPGRFGPLTDEALISAGTWQYAHYYDPAA